MSALLNILQEGNLELLSSGSRLSVRYAYTISSDGKILCRSSAGLLVKIIDLIQCEFSYNKIQLPVELYGVQIIENGYEPFVVMFEALLDYKKFCFACFKICGKNSLAQAICVMGWSSDLAELGGGAPNSKPARRMSAKTFVHVNLDDGSALGDVGATLESKGTDAEGSADITSQLDDCYAACYARAKEQILLAHSNSPPSALCFSSGIGRYRHSDMRVSSIFSSPSFVRVLPPIHSSEKFRPADISMFEDGSMTLVFKSNSSNSDDDEGSLYLECKKVLCRRYEESIASADDQRTGLTSDLQNIAVEVTVFHGNSAEMPPSGRAEIAHMLTECEQDNNALQHIRRDYMIIVFPSLAISKKFLSSISKTVSIHNVVGFLVDMHWVDPDAEDRAEAHPISRTGDSQRRSQGSTVTIDSHAVKTLCRGFVKHASSVEIFLPPTVLEEDAASDTSEVSLHEQNTLQTRLGAYNELEPKSNSPIEVFADDTQQHSSILRRLRSSEMQSSYNELDESHDIESQQAIQKPRASRISWLFGGKAKKETGPVAVPSEIEIPCDVVVTALQTEDPDQPRPDTHQRKKSYSRSRFSFLQRILQSHKEENGTFNHSDLSIGDFRTGVKGQKQSPTAATSVASTRATRIFGDGLGCAVGGLQLDMLVVKPAEFSLRFLEMKLREALPPLVISQIDAVARNDTTYGDGLDTATLTLDGADVSRVKHVEIIVYLLKTSLSESQSMVRSWSSAAVGTDIPDHWKAFMQENPATFERLVRERKLKLAGKQNHSSESNESVIKGAGSSLSSHSGHGRLVDGYDRESTASHTSTNETVESNTEAKDVMIHELSLRYCSITARGVGIIVDSLRLNQTLVSLNLCGNFINTATVAASLGNMLNFNEHLVELNVQETELGNTGATMVAQALHINSTVEKLIMSGNQIGSQGCAMIALMLEENTTLTHLNLSRNEIGGQGAKILANALYVNRSLSYLDINRQKLKGKIGAYGTKYLAQGLRMNNSLRVLRLARNRIGLEGSRHISGMLLVNRGLRILDLAYSKLGVEGAMQLGGALHQNNSLRSIVLGNRLLPVCVLKGVHDADYYLRQSRSSLPVDVSITHHSVQISDGLGESAPVNRENTQTLSETVDYALEDDVYNATSDSTLNCDIIYECGEKKFDRIDMQVLVVSSMPTISESRESTDPQNVTAGRVSSNGASSESGNPRLSTQSGQAKVIIPLPLSDEESVLIAHLVCNNNLLQELRLENTYLPIQQLRGRNIYLGSGATPALYALDLSFSNLMSSDAIITGMLISENPCLRTVCLRGNYFNKTEGETWIADALSKNSTLCLDTNMWTAEEMFSDGYHQLAALKGVSASGAAIEPQRLDALSDKLFVVIAPLAYYLDISTDIYVTQLYANKPDVYQRSWVIWSAIIICLPTFMTLCSIARATWMRSMKRALQQMLLVILQLHPILHMYESILMGIETTALLDLKFLEGVYENIPQIFLQTYIMFNVSVTHGTFALSIFFSVLISLASISGILVMLVDRGKVRKASLGPKERNPWFVRWTARVVAVVLESDMIQTGSKQQAMKRLVNYSCFLYAHFFWAMILQFSTLSVRVIALTWLLAVVPSYQFVVFILVFLPRVLILVCFDPKSKRRSLFRNTLWCCCYCLITAIWDKDDRYPMASRRAYLYVNILDTVESVVFISYAGFISQNSRMKFYHGVFVVVSVIFFKILSWALMMTWQLPVHFPELIVWERKSNRTFCGRVKAYLIESDSKVFAGGIVVAPRRNPSAVSSMDGAIPRLKKTWWSSGERSATMELSYISALLSKQTPFFKSETAAAAPVPAVQMDVDVDVGRTRGAARDWETMPEAIRQSKGRFTLRGGSKRYSDEDLRNNIANRKLSGHCHRGKSKNKFLGWNRQVVGPPNDDERRSEKPLPDVEEQEQELGSVDLEMPLASWTKRHNVPRTDQKRRATANVHYDDFIPRDSREESSEKNLRDSSDVVKSDGDTDNRHTEVARKFHEDIVWMENPTNTQCPGGFRVSDVDSL